MSENKNKKIDFIYREFFFVGVNLCREKKFTKLKDEGGRQE
jgi:hypothetical protein